MPCSSNQRRQVSHSRWRRCASPASISVKLGQVGRLLQRRAALEQPGAGHRRQLLAEQPDRMPAACWPSGRSAARGRRRRLPGPARRRMASMRMSMSGLSRWNCSSRGISHIEANEAKVVSATLGGRRSGGSGAPRRRCAAATADTASSNCAPALVSSTARVWRRNRLTPDFFFQRLDLAAHGRLGERHFLGRGAEVQVPGDRFEGAQMAGRDRPGAQVGLGMLHGAGASDGGWIDANRESIA